MAERGGFEPPVQFLTVRRFSKPLLSTTQPPLRLSILPDFFHLHRLSLTVFASSCDDCNYFVTLLQLRHSPHFSLGVRMSIAQRGPYVLMPQQLFHGDWVQDTASHKPRGKRVPQNTPGNAGASLTAFLNPVLRSLNRSPVAGL